MKIVTVVGARPQFVKAAVVSRLLRERHQEILVHTGQHYDKNMSAVFFEELGIPEPDYNLGIQGGTHGKMTGAMLAAVEDVLISEEPNALLVYGDTNSTIAGALAAIKLHIPVYHVEAGLRFGSLSMPEEVNRVLTDRISEKLFCPTESAVENLKAEGICRNVYLTGDIMYDAYLQMSSKAGQREKRYCGRYYLLTVHREENSNPAALAEVFRAMAQLDARVIYPVHPRNAKLARSLAHPNIELIEPVGYLEMIGLLNRCEKVITDSGGLQREAFFAGKPCVTLLDHAVWPETHIGNRNQLAKCECGDILRKLSAQVIMEGRGQPFGDGRAAEKIIAKLETRDME